jgi:hypothetical protein
MTVSEAEIAAARDAIVAHSKQFGRSSTQVIAVFKETIRQLQGFLQDEQRSITSEKRH